MTHSSEHVVVNMATPIEVGGIRTRGGIAGAALFVLGLLAGVLLF